MRKNQKKTEENFKDLRNRNEIQAPSTIKPFLWEDPKENGKFFLVVLAKPNAKQDRIYKDGENFCIDIHSPPIDGKANIELIKLISSQINLPKNAICLVRGHTSHQKTFIIFAENLTLNEIERRLFSN